MQGKDIAKTGASFVKTLLLQMYLGIEGTNREELHFPVYP